MALVAAVTAALGLVPAAAGTSRATASAPPRCSASAVHLGAWTVGNFFGPGQSIELQSSITNVSSRSCSVWVGMDPGFSPSFVVSDPAGTTVWDACRQDDGPGACYQILVAHPLAPGRSLVRSVNWDQGSRQGHDDPSRRVPPGVYSLTTHYQYIASEATATFSICSWFLSCLKLWSPATRPGWRQS